MIHAVPWHLKLKNVQLWISVSKETVYQLRNRLKNFNNLDVTQCKKNGLYVQIHIGRAWIWIKLIIARVKICRLITFVIKVRYIDSSNYLSVGKKMFTNTIHTRWDTTIYLLMTLYVSKNINKPLFMVWKLILLWKSF